MLFCKLCPIGASVSSLAVLLIIFDDGDRGAIMLHVEGSGKPVVKRNDVP